MTRSCRRSTTCNAGVNYEISVRAQHSSTLNALAASETLNLRIPGAAFPGVLRSRQRLRDVIAQLPLHTIVLGAVPDRLHYEVLPAALAADWHICSVKPLVFTARESIEIESEAFTRGLLVSIESHK